eukprot:GDKJ01038011.1.p1 GENE.GDKJ01038011.1~~GDKJ01038011.1.p1  ORF type:complete len:603 (-),score=211.03 GDKJ01038011.1:722-2494(-)
MGKASLYKQRKKNIKMATTQQPTSSATLYVGDLIESVVESDLFEVFSPIGTVASIRLIRDSTTYRSLCYAYVNYEDVQSAERALDILNHTPIKGKPCRVMWKNGDIALRKSGLGNLYVKNLATTVDNKALNEAFSIYGNILSCKVMVKPSGESAGFGFVQFDCEEAANKAIEALHNTEFCGRQIFVAHFKCRKDRDAEIAQIPREVVIKPAPVFTNLYIKDFPNEWTEEILTNLFKLVPSATVTSVAFRVDSKLSLPYGFVNLESAESAKLAVEVLNGRMCTPTGILSAEESETIVAAKTAELKAAAEQAAIAAGEEYKDRPVVVPGRLYVARAQSKKERENILKEQFEERGAARVAAAQALTQHFYNGSNLFIKFLNTNVDDIQLKSVFDKFGPIISARVNKDKDTNAPKGFGFLAFDNNDSAAAAVAALHNTFVEGVTAEGKLLHVSIAERRSINKEETGKLAAAASTEGKTRGPKTARPAAAGKTGAATGKTASPANGKNTRRAAPSSESPLFARVSKIANADEQKRYMGEALYVAISKIEPVHAPKLTGMMLEMPLNVLCVLVENPTHLRAKVDEAMEVLKSHNAL